MRIGVSLPIRKLADDINAITAFAQAVEELKLIRLSRKFRLRRSQLEDCGSDQYHTQPVFS